LQLFDRGTGQWLKDAFGNSFKERSVESINNSLKLLSNSLAEDITNQEGNMLKEKVLKTLIKDYDVNSSDVTLADGKVNSITEKARKAFSIYNESQNKDFNVNIGPQYWANGSEELVNWMNTEPARNLLTTVGFFKPEDLAGAAGSETGVEKKPIDAKIGGMNPYAFLGSVADRSRLASVHDIYGYKVQSMGSGDLGDKYRKDISEEVQKAQLKKDEPKKLVIQLDLDQQFLDYVKNTDANQTKLKQLFSDYFKILNAEIEFNAK
jgi:hypothetical protein